jgi:hypothetical protein
MATGPNTGIEREKQEKSCMAIAEFIISHVDRIVMVELGPGTAMT